MYDVICVGTATQDVFVSSDQAHLIRVQDIDHEQAYLAYEYGAKLSVDELFITTGGGAVNTSIAFSRLGLRAGIICEVGQDDAANMIERALHVNGVDVRMMTRSPGVATGYSVILTGLTGDRTVLVHRGAACCLTCEDIKWELVRKTRWIYLSSLSGDSGERWDDMARFAAQEGLRLAINPGSHQIKRGLDGLREILAATEIIFVNKREAYQLTGVEEKRGDTDEREAVHRLLEAGCRNVIMTMGDEGAAASDGSAFHVVPAPRVKVVSNLGAGDAFASGCLTAIDRGWSLREALKAGTLNSASVIVRMGATENLLDWSTIATELGHV